MDRNFWKNRTVLVTGHTGFKGSWLSIWLHHMGAKVVGYALDPENEENNFVVSKLSEKVIDIRGDIRDRDSLEKVFDTYKPEIVFHLAAQPIVLKSYENPVETYEINVMGTLNVLEVIRKAGCVRSVVMITTDKCYENKETMTGYKETDPFGGYDPYSSSKACDEILISSYRNSFFPLEKYEDHKVAIASVRAGNVIGGGDWAENRLVPDCIRAIEENKNILIRNRNSIRPWQHVLEPLSGYIEIAEKLYSEPKKYSGGWNFGPNEDGIWNVWEVAKKVIEVYGKGKLEDHSDNNAPHEAGKLLLNIDKAKTILGWKPRTSVDEAIEMTVEWYRERFIKNPYHICIEQIEKYMS